jgi:hypothetical protein
MVVLTGKEGWPSGRRRSTRNRLGAHKVPRGFESLSLRHSHGPNTARAGILALVERVVQGAERCESWLNRHAWRACVLQKGTVGSNPTLSANGIVGTALSLAVEEQHGERYVCGALVS